MFGHKVIEGRFERLDVALAEMGGVVEKQLSDALSAFERRDVAAAKAVARRDSDVDALERAVDEHVVGLLEQHRLGADQLRHALTALKIAAEMERVGDLAKNVANRTDVIVAADRLGTTRGAAEPVQRMGAAALTQLSSALDALFRRDPVAAHAVRDADGQIDDLYNSVFAEVLGAMAADAALAPVGMHLLFAAKNLERIGDHATNIAERVHFGITGEEIVEPRPKTDATSVVGIAAE